MNTTMACVLAGRSEEDVFSLAIWRALSMASLMLVPPPAFSELVKAIATSKLFLVAGRMSSEPSTDSFLRDSVSGEVHTYT